MACKKCKKICKYCLNSTTGNLVHEDGSRIYGCSKVKEVKISCIDGNSYDVHYKCEELNSEGSCKFYKENAKLKLEDKIAGLLSKYIDEFVSYHSDYCDWDTDEDAKNYYDHRTILSAAIGILIGNDIQLEKPKRK